jgi:hypothetical protein
LALESQNGSRVRLVFGNKSWLEADLMPSAAPAMFHFLSTAAVSLALAQSPVLRWGGIWSLDLEGASAVRLRAKVLDLLIKEKGETTEPLDAFPAAVDGSFAQVSVRIPRAGAERALKGIRRLASVRRLERRDGPPPGSEAYLRDPVLINVSLKSKPGKPRSTVEKKKT